MTAQRPSREQHMRSVYIVGTEKRGKTSGLKMLCLAEGCEEHREMFVAGHVAADAYAVAEGHVNAAVEAT